MDHTLDVPGANDGSSAAGYVDNFAWGELEDRRRQRHHLADGNSTPGGGFYVGVVAGAILSGLDVTNIDGAPGLDIYYNPGLAGNAYLGDKTYALTGGGCSPRALRRFPSPRPGR